MLLLYFISNRTLLANSPITASKRLSRTGELETVLLQNGTASSWGGVGLYYLCFSPNKLIKGDQVIRTRGKNKPFPIRYGF